jgi:hypothetical protein
MMTTNDDDVVAILSEIRTWIRAASFSSVKSLLELALPDDRLRSAYQMFDGSASSEEVRIACKMSPNALVDYTQRWTSMGLMEVTSEKRRRRLFDLADFGLVDKGAYRPKVRRR